MRHVTERCIFGCSWAFEAPALKSVERARGREKTKTAAVTDDDAGLD